MAERCALLVLGVLNLLGSTVPARAQAAANPALARLVTPSDWPATLAGTGAFSDPALLVPGPAVLPYDINVPFWSDGAIKRRWFALPTPGMRLGFRPEGNWDLPVGSVWIKHFDLQLVTGDPASARRIETRLLVRTGNGVMGATYRWGDSRTDAMLVPEQGLEETFEIQTGGQRRTQRWRYPSREQCLRCHTAVAGFALGFNTPQLNRDCPDLALPRNQLARWNGEGRFATNVTAIHTLRALAHATNTGASVEFRVRSYLAANCVQCHQPGGVPWSYWDARITTPLAATGLIGGPLYDELENPDNRVVVPGDPIHSVLLARLQLLDYTHMPPLGTSVLNQEAIALLTDWITNKVTGYRSLAAWQTQYFGGGGSNPMAAPGADPDGDGVTNLDEYLTGGDPGQAADVWQLGVARSEAGVRLSFRQPANRSGVVEWNREPGNPSGWLPLDVPGNHPWFPAAARDVTLLDPDAANAAKYYRVRIEAP